MTKETNNLDAMRRAIEGKAPDKCNDPHLQRSGCGLTVRVWHPDLTADDDEPDDRRLQSMIDDAFRAFREVLGLTSDQYRKFHVGVDGREFIVEIDAWDPGDELDWDIDG